MGRIWDKLFHRSRYKAIISTFETLKYQCFEGIDIFLKQNQKYWSDTYEFKEFLFQYAEEIRNLQKEHDIEEQRKKEIKERSEHIKEHYRYGFGYYTFKENLKRSKPSDILNMMSLKYRGEKPILDIIYIPTPEQICGDFDYIEKCDTLIQSLICLKKDCPEGFVSCAKAHSGNPFSSLEPPYDYISFNLINKMSDLTDEVKLHQRVHDLKRKCPNGVRLVIGSDSVDDLASIDQRVEEIRQAEHDYHEVIEMLEQNLGMVNYVIRETCNESSSEDVLSLEAIRQVLKYKQLLNDDDINECDFFMSLSDAQQRYILMLPSSKQQKAYILRNIFSTKAVAIASAEPGDCNPVVQDFLKDCECINTEGVTYGSYFTTVSRLAQDDYCIYSALTLIKRHRSLVEQFYDIEKDAALPFSALLDVYYNNRLSQAMLKAETFRVDADKADSIMKMYPLGYKSLLAQGRIKDILRTGKASHDELKWIIANENVFSSEQAAKEQEEKINRAKSIISSNSEAVRRLMPDINIHSLSSTQANNVIWRESELSILTRILNEVSFWEETQGIPHYFFYWYYPTRYGVTNESQKARELIWDFKDGILQERVTEIVKEKLRSTFGSDCSRLTLVCIPASKIYNNNCRYAIFSNSVCEDLNMNNAFDKITITKEKEPSHLGGMNSAEYEFETSFFKGKYVVLFDDVVTRGHSIAWFKRILESFGAIVICAISIGRTYSDYYGDKRKPHPWSGKY